MAVVLVGTVTCTRSALEMNVQIWRGLSMASESCCHHWSSTAAAMLRDPVDNLRGPIMEKWKADLTPARSHDLAQYS